MKVEGLETEVAALKTLVLTSTPSQPNKHLHPQVLRINTGCANSAKNSRSHGFQMAIAIFSLYVFGSLSFNDYGYARVHLIPSFPWISPNPARKGRDQILLSGNTGHSPTYTSPCRSTPRTTRGSPRRRARRPKTPSMPPPRRGR